MSKFTFILGLSGSGKSYLADEMKRKDQNIVVIDDAFHPTFNKDTFESNVDKLKVGVDHNYDAIIIEGAFCFKDFRAVMTPYLQSLFPSVELEWVCFENDIDKANKNLDRLDREDRDPVGHKQLNENLKQNYTYPDNCKIIPIFED